MDKHTLDLLEFDKVRGLVAGYAHSELGRAKARALEPLSDIARIHEALARTSEMVEAIEARQIPPVGRLSDIRVWLRRAALGVLLEVEQFQEVRDVLELSARTYDYWLRLEADQAHLGRLLSDLTDQRHLIRAIDAVIDSRGHVRDSASTELAGIRARIARLADRVDGEIRRLVRDPDVRRALRYPGATLSGDHHVLPVAVNHRHAVLGIVHRTSSTGETLYVEPAKVAELTAEMTRLRSAETREVRRVLRRLSEQIGREAQDILTAVEILAELDFVHAKALYSRDYRMSCPVLTTNGHLRLTAARHPVLEHWRRQPAAPPDSFRGLGGGVVPIDVHLGEDFDLLVLTGPNTGGKTVALKTVGLVAAMALSGLHVPADAGSRIPFVRDILADIGDEQSIEQSLSTFSGHMKRIAEVLASAGPDTLVLLDELGAGTEPSEGAALGQAILDELLRLRCRCMVTTHLGDLKLFALSADRAENAAMEFDPQTLRPTFRLVIGQFGKSCALKIARGLRLPRALIARAYRHLRRGRDRDGRPWAALQQLRRAAEEARQRAQEREIEAHQAAAEFRRQTGLLQQEAEVSAQIAQLRSALEPGDPVRVLRFDKTGSVVRVDHRKGTALVAVGAIEWDLPLADLIPLVPRSQ